MAGRLPALLKDAALTALVAAALGLFIVGFRTRDIGQGLFFDYQFVGLYGMNTDNLVVWNSFLSGQIDAAGLTKGLQQITDKVRNDSSVKKIPVTK